MRFFVLILAICIASGCSPTPWKIEDYIAVKGPRPPWPWERSATSYDNSSRRYDNFKVNNAVVQVYFRPHNWSFYSGNSPYNLFIYTYGSHNLQKKAIIHKVIVNNDEGKKYKLIDKFPVELPFQNMGGDYNFSVANLDAKTFFPFDFADLPLHFFDREKISVSVEIEIVTSKKSEKKMVNYKFRPKLRWGLVQWMQP